MSQHGASEEAAAQQDKKHETHAAFNSFRSTFFR